MEQTTEVFGYKVKYDAESESAKHALAFFQEIGEGGAKSFFDEARHDLVNHLTHFKVKNHEKENEEYHLTLIYNDDGTYHLRKRTGF